MKTISNLNINNDIDDFCSFDLSTVSKSNELVGFVDAFKIKEWFEKNPEKAGRLPQKLSELSSIKEEENPVVIIATLK